MARYRKISVRIWNDAKFSHLSDDGKLAFFFVLTHPHMTSLGAMRATVPGIAAELGWPAERLSKAFKEATLKGILKVDSSANCVLLPNFIKHNPPESPNVIKAWEKAVDEIPECILKTEAIQYAYAYSQTMTEGFRKAFESLGEAFAKSMPYQEQEQEQEQEPNTTTSSTRVDRCPTAEIIKLFSEHAPSLVQPRITPDAVKAQIAARWRESPEHQRLEFWQEFFKYCEQSDFLAGRSDGRGAKPFRVGLEWVVKSSNFAKIINGNYHGESATA